MQMFVVLLAYVKPLSDVEAHLAEHRRFLDRHYAEGRFVASGPQVPRTGGVILVKGQSRDELDSVLAEDPFHREGVATYEIVEFNPIRFAIGAEAIFAAK